MKKYAIFGFFLAFLIAFTLSPQPIQAQLDMKSIVKTETFVQNPTITTCKGSICDTQIKGSKRIWKINYYKIDPSIDVKIVDIVGNDTVRFEVTSSSPIPFKSKELDNQFALEKVERQLTSGTNVVEYNGAVTDQKFIFGQNSTELSLNYSYDLGDCKVSESSPDTNFGSNAYVEAVGGANERWGYSKWDISGLESNITITFAQLCFKYATIGANAYARIYHVYNQTWGEYEITWNNNPCSKYFNETSQCNLTYESEIHATSPNGEQCFNITNMLKKDYDLGNQNFSEVHLPSNRGDSSDYIMIYSKEQTGFEPYMNITYIVQDTTDPIVTLNAPPNNEWQRSLPITFNATGTDTGSGILNSSLWHNCNGAWHLNATNIHANQTTVDSIFNVYMEDTNGCQWNFEFCDSAFNGSNCAFAGSNFTVKLDTTSPVVTFIDPTPNGDLIEPFSNIIINVSVTEPFNDTVVLDWNGANETLTQCLGKINDTFTCWIQKNNLQIGAYNFQVFANDTGNYWGSTEIRNVTVSWNYTVTVQVDLDLMKNLKITNKTCLNEDVLQIVWEEQHELGGFSDQFKQIQNEYCDWGCDFVNKRCRFDPLTTMLYFLIFMGYMVSIIVIPLITITRKTNKKLLKLILDLTTLFVVAIIYFSTSTFLLLPVTTFLGINYTVFIVSMILILMIFYLILIFLFARNGLKNRYR